MASTEWTPERLRELADWIELAQALDGGEGT